MGKHIIWIVLTLLTLAGLAVLASPLSAEEDDRVICEFYGDVAGEIMAYRQVLTPIRDVMATVELDWMRDLVLNAYREPSWHGATMQTEEIEKFRSMEYARCMS